MSTDLSLLSYDTTETFSLSESNCKIVSVYDADIFHVAVHLPGHGPTRFTARLKGVDTPEIRPRRGAILAVKEKTCAKICRNILMKKIIDNNLLEDPNIKFTPRRIREICARSRKLLKIVPHGFDKYGRVLVDLYDNGESINEYMLNGGYARPYDGGKRIPWSEEELNIILQHNSL